MTEIPVSDFEVVVPVASGEEDCLLGETLNQLAETLAGADGDEGTLLIVKSEYGDTGLIKKVIFEDEKPAGQFLALWQAAQRRLAHDA